MHSNPQNISICEVITQNELEVGSDMLLVSNYFILQTYINRILKPDNCGHYSIRGYITSSNIFVTSTIYFATRTWFKPWIHWDEMNLLQPVACRYGLLTHPVYHNTFDECPIIETLLVIYQTSMMLCLLIRKCWFKCKFHMIYKLLEKLPPQYSM